jgi:ribonuclease Z
MKKFEVTVLGSNAALPQEDRHTSSQIINFNENLFLVDCGEGTQLRLSDLNIKRNRISHIFISHLHGDHSYGLPGLLTSFNHFSRTKDLNVYGVKGIKKFILDIFDNSYAFLDYQLIIHEFLDDKQYLIFEDEHMAISCFPLDHRVPTIGYKFVEKPYSNINPDTIEKYQLSINEIKAIKKNIPIHRNGKRLAQDELLTSYNELRGYAYMSDTKYNLDSLAYIEGVTTLYHEATYLHVLLDKAVERGHSTAHQAATFAELAKVKKLLMGHFSSRYDKRQVFRDEAQKIFKNSFVVKDGLEYQVV